MEFDEVERMLEEDRQRREGAGAPAESTLSDYVRMYMQSTGYNEDGRIDKR